MCRPFIDLDHLGERAVAIVKLDGSYGKLQSDLHYTRQLDGCLHNAPPIE